MGPAGLAEGGLLAELMAMETVNGAEVLLAKSMTVKVMLAALEPVLSTGEV